MYPVDTYLLVDNIVLRNLNWKWNLIFFFNLKMSTQKTERSRRPLETMQFYLFTFNPRALIRLRSIYGTLTCSKGVFWKFCSLIIYMYIQARLTFFEKGLVEVSTHFPMWLLVVQSCGWESLKPRRKLGDKLQCECKYVSSICRIWVITVNFIYAVYLPLLLQALWTEKKNVFLLFNLFLLFEQEVNVVVSNKIWLFVEF